MKSITIFAAVSLLLSQVQARPNLAKELKRNESKRLKEIHQKYEDNPNVETKWFSAKIDHFDNHGASEATY